MRSLLGISGALHLGIFEHPATREYFLATGHRCCLLIAHAAILDGQLSLKENCLISRKISLTVDFWEKVSIILR